MCINLKEVEVRIEVGLHQSMYIKVVQDIIKTLEVEQGTVQIMEVVMVTNMRGNQRYRTNNNNNNRRDNYRIKVTIGTGVDHMKGRVEIGEIIEV